MTKVRLTIFTCLLSFLTFSQIADSFWIGEDFNWEHPNTGDPEIDSAIFGNISSIYFASNGQYRLRSGYGSITEYDTLYHWAESAIYGGTWKLVDSTAIEIEYELLVWVIKPTEVPTKRIIRIELNEKGFSLESRNYSKSVMLSLSDKKTLARLASIQTEIIKKR